MFSGARILGTDSCIEIELGRDRVERESRGPLNHQEPAQRQYKRIKMIK